MITILQVKKGGHKVLTWEDEKFKAFIENKNPIDVETMKDVWGWVRLFATDMAIRVIQFSIMCVGCVRVAPDQWGLQPPPALLQR